MKFRDLGRATGLPIDESVLEWNSAREVSSYEIISIPVGRIHRYLDGKVYSLTKTDSWRFLHDPTNAKVKDDYERYSVRARCDNPERSPELFLSLAHTMGDYDIGKGPIIVDQNYSVVDGLHRSCLILDRFGKDHIISVLRVHLSDMRFFGIGAKARYLLYLAKRVAGLDV